MDAKEIPKDLMDRAWLALFGPNIVKTPIRKVLVLAAARFALAEAARLTQPPKE